MRLISLWYFDTCRSADNVESVVEKKRDFSINYELWLTVIRAIYII